MSTEWSARGLEALETFVQANASVDWREQSLEDPELLRSLQWPVSGGEDLVPLLKAYQRLLFVLPLEEAHRAIRLLGAGLHSAIQIAGMPRAELARAWEALFPGEAELGEQVRRNAVARRSQLALEHMKALQSNELHYRAARFR